MTGIIIPKIAAHCTGDGCEYPGEHLCAKCNTMVCQNIGGIIGDEGMRALVKRFRGGHAVYCMYCRFIAKPHVYCVSCAGDHEIMLSFRGSCRTAYRSLHEANYGNEEESVVGRTQDDATEMRDRRIEKYEGMDSTNPDGAKLIRSQEEQDRELQVHEETDPDTGETVTVLDEQPTPSRED